MTKLEAKKYLSRVKDIIRAENRILDQIRRLEDRQLTITRQISDMPRGTTPFTTLDYVVELDELRRKLVNEHQQEIKAYREILLVLNQLNGIERDIMIMHYLMMLTWEEIACRIEKSYRWTQKLHGRALEKVVIILS